MMSYLSIFAQFKNEAHILKEWTQHYLEQGVNSFWLVNNASTDNYINQLSHLPPGCLHLSDDSRKHAQRQILIEKFEQIREKSEWLMLCDLDEFVYARKDYGLISDYLKTLGTEVSAVYIPWKLFGSSGQKKQPRSVRRTFLHRAHYEDGCSGQGMARPNRIFSKYIVRCSAVKKLYVHFCMVSSGLEITSDGKPHRGKGDIKAYAKVNETILRNSCLHLNHYAIQSEEFFFGVKATRGDVDGPEKDAIRNLAYFNAFDINDRVDVELRQIALRKKKRPGRRWNTQSD